MVYKYVKLVLCTVIIISCNCCRREKPYVTAKGENNSLPDEIFVKVDVNSPEHIEGLSRDQMQQMIDKILIEMKLENAAEDSNKVENNIMIHIDIENNEQKGLYSYSCRTRIYKSKNKEDAFSGYSLKADMNIHSSKEYPKDRLAKAVKQELMSQMLIISVVLYGSDRTSGLTEEKIRYILGE